MLFVAVWLYPVSNVLTRSSGLVLLLVVWFGLIALLWRLRLLRLILLSGTVLVALFLVLPARSRMDASWLRSAYVADLGRYEGVTYYWGGESPKGIDCSGLIRRGLIDASFLRGIRLFDPGLIRYAVWLWWHDSTASDLGQQRGGLTVHLLDAPSVNKLNYTQVLPGDLAVVGNGVHIMAYLGNNVWIEADPLEMRVIRVTVPSHDNHWFLTPTKLVRWTVFQQ